MSYLLAYKVVNSATTQIPVEVEIDGEKATATLVRCVVEAVPVDRAGKTLTMVLPLDALDTFPEGAAITITADLTPAPSTPATQEA